MAARYPSTVMVSVVCPWDDREQLDEAIFRREIDHALGAGFRHIYVFGTAGEGYAVDSARFRRVVEVLHDQMSGTPDARPMAGVIGLSTANILERVQVAHDIGIREFQISFPMWQTLTDLEVPTFFQDICGAFPDSLFMHYNTARVGRVVSGYQYRSIVAAVPNLVATKTLTSDLITVGNVVRESPELMHFLSEQTISQGAMFGEVGLLGTFGSLAPKKSWAVWQAANAGRYRDAASIGAWFERVNRVIFDPLFVDRRVDGAYDKTIEKLSPGLEDFPLRMLSPYRTISEEEFEAARATFREQFPDCE